MATTHLIGRADGGPRIFHRQDNLDRALEHHGLAPRVVGRLFSAAVVVMAARQEAPS